MPANRPWTTPPPSIDRRFEELFKRKLAATRLSYASLLKDAQESFKQHDVPVQGIAEAASYAYKKQPELSPIALSSMHKNEVWASFKKHTAWYNCGVVEAVVRLHGNVQDKKNLEEFKKDRTRLVHWLQENPEHGKDAKVILKLEEEFKEFSNERLEQVCLTVCDLLETKTCPLDVQEGCVKVTMSIPVDVAEDVFPLSPAMLRSFQKTFPTLMSISCGRITETFEVSTALCYRYVLYLNTFCVQITQDTDDSASLDGQQLVAEEVYMYSNSLWCVTA